MRAAVCYEFGQPLVIEEIELERPNAGEIRVDVAACAICHSDISWWDGSWGGILPAVFGHEAAGVVVEVGPDVDVVVPGDHVIVSLIRYCGRCYYCAQGEPALCETRFRLDETGPLRRRDGVVIRQGLRTAAFAEEVVVHASQAVAIRQDVPLDAACLLACGVITGVGAVVNTARVPVGSSVVVIGTGGVGLNSVQGAALSGATPIIGIDVAAEKLEAARAFGATHVINATREDAREAVLSLTEGRGADYVFATVGAKGPIEQGLSLLRRAGTLVIVGMPASGVMTEFEPGELANDSQRILGSKVGSARPEIDLPKLLELHRQGRLKLDELVSRRYPFEEINDAIASVKRGVALRNVIMF